MSTINKEVTVEIAGEQLSIKPFVLRNRDKVLKLLASAFGELSKKFPDLASAPQDELITSFIDIAGDRVIDIYTMVLGKDREWLLDNLTLADEINVLTTVMEINNLPLLVSQLKKFQIVKK